MHIIIANGVQSYKWRQIQNSQRRALWHGVHGRCGVRASPTSPPGPLSNFAALRGEGEPEKTSRRGETQKEAFLVELVWAFPYLGASVEILRVPTRGIDEVVRGGSNGRDVRMLRASKHSGPARRAVGFE